MSEASFDARFEWAYRSVLGQSFGPWIYHHGPDTEPEDWCEECRATWELREAIGDVEEGAP